MITKKCKCNVAFGKPDIKFIASDCPIHTVKTPMIHGSSFYMLKDKPEKALLKGIKKVLKHPQLVKERIVKNRQNKEPLRQKLFYIFMDNITWGMNKKDVYANKIITEILKIISDEKREVVLGERSRWINQPHNEHDKRIRREMLSEIKRRIEARMEIHTHNSIPSYDADLDEGCLTCIKNHELIEVVQLLEDFGK